MLKHGVLSRDDLGDGELGGLGRNGGRLRRALVGGAASGGELGRDVGEPGVAALRGGRRGWCSLLVWTRSCRVRSGQCGLFPLFCLAAVGCRRRGSTGDRGRGGNGGGSGRGRVTAARVGQRPCPGYRISRNFVWKVHNALAWYFLSPAPISEPPRFSLPSPRLIGWMWIANLWDSRASSSSHLSSECAPSCCRRATLGVTQPCDSVSRRAENQTMRQRYAPRGVRERKGPSPRCIDPAVVVCCSRLKG